MPNWVYKPDDIDVSLFDPPLAAVHQAECYNPPYVTWVIKLALIDHREDLLHPGKWNTKCSYKVIVEVLLFHDIFVDW